MKLIRGSSEDKSVVYDAELALTVDWLETRFTVQGDYIIAIGANEFPSISFIIRAGDPDRLESELEKLIDISPPPTRDYAVNITVKGTLRSIEYQTPFDGIKKRNVFTIKDWKWIDGSTTSPKSTTGVAGPPANTN